MLAIGGVAAGLSPMPLWAQDGSEKTDKDKSRLILLGTAGGPSPKPNRAAPSNVIIAGGNSYLVDCGNRVARQMILAGLKLESLRGVFLTHHHSDHNADIGNILLLAWANNLAKPVDYFGPPPLDNMMQHFFAMNHYDIATRIHDEGRVDPAALARISELRAPGEIYRDEHLRVSCVLVNHPPVMPAFAYRFDCADRSIVISGDTAPSDALIELATGADILVHEVMMIEALDALIATEPNAARLREHLLASHSTSQQVGEIATKTGVKTLVLSHFVPGGYPFIEDQQWYDAVRPHFSGELIVGRDLMEI